MGVEAIRRDQVVMGAHLRDGPLLQDADHVRVSYCRQPMSYGDAGPAFHRFVQGRLHHLRAKNNTLDIFFFFLFVLE